jgi:hypothetical protein
MRSDVGRVVGNLPGMFGQNVEWGRASTLSILGKRILANFVQELPVLAGVVVGALASYVAGAAAERTRWHRQQSARWDENVLRRMLTTAMP